MNKPLVDNWKNRKWIKCLKIAKKIPEATWLSTCGLKIFQKNNGKNVKITDTQNTPLLLLSNAKIIKKF